MEEEFSSQLHDYYTEIAESRYETAFSSLCSLFNKYESLRIKRNETETNKSVEYEVLLETIKKFLTICLKKLTIILKPYIEKEKQKIRIKNLSSAQRRYHEYRKQKLANSFRTEDSSSNVSSEFTNFSTEEVSLDKIIYKSLKWCKFISMLNTISSGSTLESHVSTLITNCFKVFEEIIISIYNETIQTLNKQISNIADEFITKCSCFSQVFSELFVTYDKFVNEILINVDERVLKHILVSLNNTTKNAFETLFENMKQQLQFQQVSSNINDLTSLLELITYILRTRLEFIADSVELAELSKCLNYLESEYFTLELNWLNHHTSTLLSEEIKFQPKTDETTTIHASIESIFFVYKTSLIRSISWKDQHTANAILNIISQRFEDDLLPFLKNLLRPKNNGVIEKQNSSSDTESNASQSEHEDAFDSILNSTMSGRAHLNKALLFGINSIQLSANFTLQLITLLKDQYSTIFTSNIERFLTTLDELNNCANQLQQFVKKALEEIEISCINKEQSILYRKERHFLKNLTYADNEVVESTLVKFLTESVFNDPIILKAKANLNAECFSILLSFVFDRFINGLLTRIIQDPSHETHLTSPTNLHKVKFSEIGIIMFDEDIEFLSIQKEQLTLKDKNQPDTCLQKLKQIALLLQLPEEDALRFQTQHEDNLTALSEKEIQQLLCSKI